MDVHLLDQDVEKSVTRHDVTHTGQFALAIDVCLAELLLIDHLVDTCLAISVPNDLAPVNTPAVDGATIVKNDSLYVHCFSSWSEKRLQNDS